jgi:putative DNA primase/helicase
MNYHTGRAGGNSIPFTIEEAARLLDGQISGGQIQCPGPGHSKKDRSLCVRFVPQARYGVWVKSFANDDSSDCLEHVLIRLGVSFEANSEPTRVASARSQRFLQLDRDRQLRKARWLWSRSQYARDTLVQRYLETRGIKLPTWPRTLDTCPLKNVTSIQL